MENTTPPADNQQKRKFILLALTAIFVAAAILYSIYWLGIGRFEAYTDDAYVNGNLVQLMPQTRGTVVAIFADDTNFVTEGQPLVRLDDTDAKIALASAEARLGETVRQVQGYYENVQQLKATLALQQAEYVKAKNDYQRRQGLIGIAAVSREELQQFKTAMLAAKAQVAMTQHQLQAAKALVANVDVAHHPLVLTAAANTSAACLTMQRLTISAPVTGYVAKREVQLGQQVEPGTPLLMIVPLDHIWVDANFKESQLHNIRVGQPAMIISDIYGNRVKYHGKVIGLSPGTGSVFSLLPPQNATGNWIKIVQRLPVRIALDASQLSSYPLRVGTSTEVTIDTHQRNGRSLSVMPISQTLYETKIYHQQLANAQSLIDKIIRDNNRVDGRT